MSTRAILVRTLPVVLLCLAGCPQRPPADTTPLTSEASGPESAKAGEAVALTARVLEGGDETVEYRWYQTYGRVVALDDPTKALVHFAAPSLAAAQTLRFRVDFRTADGRTASAEVAVTIEADPNFAIGPQPDAGSDDPTPRVRLVTSLGTIVLELDREAAPITVSNFLRYVADGFYDGTIFHRVIADFVVQGGGFEPGLVEKNTRPPIINEAANGLKNLRGTVAMARTTDPDSATSQFFINLVDNENLDYTATNAGYCVFGRVIEGLDVVDEIGLVETETREGFSDVPVEDVLLERAERVEE